MSQRLRAEGVPMHAFRATTQNFSPVIIEIDAAMRAGRLRHDGNPVLAWCIGNVVGKADRRGNLYPTKSRPDQKIDAAVALMMAIGRAMVEDEQAKGWTDFSQIRSLDNDSRSQNCGCQTGAGLCTLMTVALNVWLYPSSRHSRRSLVRARWVIGCRSASGPRGWSRRHTAGQCWLKCGCGAGRERKPEKSTTWHL